MIRHQDYDISEALMRCPEYAEWKATKRKVLWITASLAYIVLAVIEPRGAALLAYIIGFALMAKD